MEETAELLLFVQTLEENAELLLFVQTLEETAELLFFVQTHVLPYILNTGQITMIIL